MAAADEKVRLTAQHIVRTLATSKNAADDMIRILSGFDDRFSDLFPSASGRAAAGDDRAATSGVGTGPIREDPSEEESRSESPLKGYEQSPRATVQEVNDQREERDGISEDDSVKLEMAEKLILMWDSSANSMSSLFETSEEAVQYLEAVDDLISLSSAQSLPTSYRVRAESSLQLAMSRLEDEFRSLLSSPTNSSTPHHTVSLRRMSLSDPSPLISDNPESPHVGELEHSFSLPLSSDVLVPFLVAPDLVLDLKEIALRMIAAHYEPELCQAYCDTRRDVLIDCLASLGVDKMSIEEVQKIDWPTLDSKMKKWTQALKIVLNEVLLEEKRVCEIIFETSKSLKDECLAEAAKGCVLQLLNFGDAIAIGKRTSEKLFRIIAMYEALAEVLPELESLFSGHAQVFIREEAEGILARLGDAVKGTILEFGNLIRGEMSKKPLQSGEIHPLTRYVMNYIRLLADYSSALNSLLADEDGSDHGTGAGTAESNLTPLGKCMLTLITYLETNLDEKKKLYDDEALQHIFIMNNLLYIVQKVKDSEMKTLLGDNWVRKRRGLIRQHSTAYLRASWTRVLSFLRDDSLVTGGSSSNRNAMKDKFKNFNNAFEDIYRVQTNWRVSDPQLREELKISISEKAVQAYRSFYGRSRAQFDGRFASRYIKYAPEDLENHVADLFEGFQGVPGNPRGREAS